MQKYIIDKNTLCSNLIQCLKTSTFNKNEEIHTSSTLKCLISDLIRNKNQIMPLIQNSNIHTKILKDILVCIINALMYSCKNVYSSKEFLLLLQNIINSYNLEEIKNNNIVTNIDNISLSSFIEEDKYIYYLIFKLQFISYRLNINDIRSYTDNSQSKEIFELRILYAVLYYSYITNSTLEKSIVDISNSKEYVCNTTYTLKDYDELDTLISLIIVLSNSSEIPSLFNDQIVKKYVLQKISTQELIDRLQTDFKYKLDHLYKQNIISSYYLKHLQ